MVYAGFGVTAPEQGYDDYAGIETKGKIVAFRVWRSAAVRTHDAGALQFGRREGNKRSRTRRRGTILLDSPALEQVLSLQGSSERPGVSGYAMAECKGQPNDYFPELRAPVILSMEDTGEFQGSGNPRRRSLPQRKKESHRP